MIRIVEKLFDNLLRLRRGFLLFLGKEVLLGGYLLLILVC